MTIPWQLELGRVDAHQLAIEHLGRELVLSFDAPLAAQVQGAPSAPMRLAIVQHGTQLELPPWPTAARSLLLPWPRAPLDDLWLLLCTARRRYWLEVPYGVCRPPGEPGEPGPAPQLGPPRPPPDVAPDDAVLPWQAIRWRLGHAGGWQLGALARPTRPGELELIARRAEPGIPPALALTATSGARAISIERHEPWSATPAPLHVARYRFPPAWLGARAYVQVTARNGAGSAGAAAFELQLPTSLTDRSHRRLGRIATSR